jgi:hypothetical protein
MADEGREEHQVMEHNDYEHRLTTNAQQAIPAWSMEGVDNGVLASPVSPALELVGLGRAASYLDAHPEYLMAALTYSDWAMRTAAVQALGKQGQYAPLQPLLDALQGSKRRSGPWSRLCMIRRGASVRRQFWRWAG